MENLESMLREGRAPFGVIQQEYVYASKLKQGIYLNIILSIYDNALTQQEGLARVRDYLYFDENEY